MKRLQLSFNAGEIAPSMLGRMDARQYQNGLATCRNFIVRPQGVVERRPGFQSLGTAYSSGLGTNNYQSRLIPFVYSVDQAMVIEMSHYRYRIWRDGELQKWATPVGSHVTSWSSGAPAGTVTFANRHGLSVGVNVKFTFGAAETVVLDPTIRAVASIVDAYTITVPLAWTGNPTKTIRCWRQQTTYALVTDSTGSLIPKFPIDYITGGAPHEETANSIRLRQPAAGNWIEGNHHPGGQVPWSGDPSYTIARLLNGGDTIMFDGIEANMDLYGGTAHGVTDDVIYYVRDVDRTYASGGDVMGRFKIARTKGGPAMVFSFTGGTVSADPTAVFNRWYRTGEYVYSHKDNGGVAPNLSRVYRIAGEWAGGQEATTNTVTSGISASAQYDSGAILIRHYWPQSKVFDVSYTQSNDVMTFVHPDTPPYELRRMNTINWDYRPINFGPTLPSPANLTKSITRGAQLICAESHDGSNLSSGIWDCWYYLFDNQVSPATWNGQPYGNAISIGDAVFVEYVYGNMANFISPDDSGYFYVGDWRGRGTQGASTDRIQLRTESGSILTTTTQAQLNGRLKIYVTSASADREQTYKVTAIDDARNESEPSSPITCENILEVVGATNTLSWDAVAGAVRYRIYRNKNGLFGLLGETEETTYEDENEALDMGITPPILDNSLSGSDYPRAVGYFEQRRCFGGTTNKPRQLWMTRTGTESDLSYTIPVQETNRISLALAARSAATIRHIVPLQDMLLITQQGEWRMFAINSDAIGPETVAVRQQSEVGGSNVRPLVINNSVIYPEVRGGHVMHLGYDPGSRGYRSGNLSLRANHLFDNYTITDSTQQRAPYPVAWFTSSSGNLLGCTYIPEEEVQAWHQHGSDDAVYESICSIPEGKQDSLYAVVNRPGVGRTVERMIPNTSVAAVATDGTAYLDDKSVHVDHAGSYFGYDYDITPGSVTVSGGTTWDTGDLVRVTATDNVFGAVDVGKYIRLVEGSVGARTVYEVEITAIVDATKIDVTLVDALPVHMRNSAVADWQLGIMSLDVTSRLNGKEVQVVLNSEYIGTMTVSSSRLTFATPAYSVVYGLPYDSDIKTLPQSFPKAEALGQGISKVVSDVWLRVINTTGLMVGPDADNLVPVQDLATTSLSSGETETAVPSEYTQSGQIMVRQSSPLPATILNVTIETAAGD